MRDTISNQSTRQIKTKPKNAGIYINPGPKRSIIDRPQVSVCRPESMTSGRDDFSLGLRWEVDSRKAFDPGNATGQKVTRQSVPANRGDDWIKSGVRCVYKWVPQSERITRDPRSTSGNKHG